MEHILLLDNLPILWITQFNKYKAQSNTDIEEEREYPFL